MANGKNVSKSDLIKMVAQETGIKEKDVRTVIDSMIGNLGAQLNRGSKVQITGFGTFEVRERQARTGVKPGTAEKINIPASKAPAFRPGKALKEQVK